MLKEENALDQRARLYRPFTRVYSAVLFTYRVHEQYRLT